MRALAALFLAAALSACAATSSNMTPSSTATTVRAATPERQIVESLVPPLGAGGAARLAIVRVYSTDLERGARFYEDVFGLELRQRVETREVVLGFPGAAPPGLVLTMTDPLRPHPNGGFAIVVADVDAVLARAAAAGGAVPRGPIDSPQARLRIGFVTDPDGATIEVLQHTSQ